MGEMTKIDEAMADLLGLVRADTWRELIRRLRHQAAVLKTRNLESAAINMLEMADELEKELKSETETIADEIGRRVAELAQRDALSESDADMVARILHNARRSGR